ncbi:hypothetical protein HED60_12930 [Planctomycetales bacterium ZRK34]|nr:hypothetical protein HED60_12930 [Planctomycetales bacterium ZRK34]
MNHRLALLSLALLSGLLTLGGCAGGTLAVRSTGEEAAELTGNFTTAVYSYDDLNNLDVLLIEGEPESPTQAVHIRMYWQPRAGRTPIDVRATNATINYVVFTGQGAGVYSGAGFLFPKNNPGGGTFTASLRSTAVRLLDASGNFADRLGRADATGSFSAKRDDDATQRLLRTVEVYLRNQLGYPRFVMAR